jgi:hypothetical protein
MQGKIKDAVDWRNEMNMKDDELILMIFVGMNKDVTG